MTEMKAKKPVIEVKRPADLLLWNGGVVMSPDLLSWRRTGAVSVVSAADAIGRDIQTERLIAIGEEERCGGLYVLGQPRTGKSNLLVSLALSDIRRNHGILFIDPHTDAINDLLGRIPENRRGDVILLDPTDRQFSFGINLLHCKDPENGTELDNACGRVREVFVKVWGDDRGQLGVWLDKIIQNSVYLLLENPGYTLYDLPPLLWEDTRFRNKLLRRVTVKTGVQDFWYNEFDRLTKRERTEQVEPALSRLNIFRNNTMVRDIVSQVESTIDFEKILKERKIVLLRLPTNLASNVKHLIGTIVLSEVLYAVFERDKLAEREREYFGIYCDEFQEFATPDFARLFTQSGKYKVMPVVAHQTRLGQFKPGDPNQGATLASPNKVLFTLSAADAKELALEFAEEPPTETVYEQQVVISHEPVKELLTGRHKPEIQVFVDTYLRHLQWRREDTKEEIERERLLRMIDVDEAALYGIDERMAYTNRQVTSQIGALQNRGDALIRAYARSQRIVALHDTSNRLRLTFRGLNTFLIEVMEGKKQPGQEEFSEFLVNLAASTSRLTETETEILQLYIRLSYGDPQRARVIPFDLSQAYGLFPRDVALLVDQSKEETEAKRKEHWQNYIREETERMQEEKRWRSERRKKEEEELWGGFDNYDLETHRFEADRNPVGTPQKAYAAYVWYCCCFRERLAPYINAKIATSDPRKGKVKELIEEIVGPRKGIVKVFFEEIADSQKEEQREPEWFRPDVYKELNNFLYRYQEGALIILSLIRGRYVEIEGCDPVDVWECMVTLANVMREKFEDTNFVENVFSSYFHIFAYFPLIPYFRSRSDYSYKEFVSKLMYRGYFDPSKDLVYCNYEWACRVPDAVIQRRWGWFSTQYAKAARCWKGLSDPKRVYLMCRAFNSGEYHFRRFDYSLPASTNPEYEGVVDALRVLIKNDRQWREQDEERVVEARERQRIENHFIYGLKNIVVPPSPYLEPRVLSVAQAREVKRACAKELAASGQAKAVAATIVEFAAFCALLSKPENHLRIKGQYAEKQVRKRTEIDMVNEMARVFTALPRYTAYAKIIEEKGGAPSIWKGKIRTAKLADVQEDKAAETRRFVLAHIKDYCRPRGRIQEEIDRRQKKRAVHAPDAPLASVKRPKDPGAGLNTQPPPTRTSGRLPRGR